jgi:hypothetical protein
MTTATKATTTMNYVFGLAAAFLGTLPDPRAPWAGLFLEWAAEQHLTDAETRAVRIEVIRSRAFRATERHKPQPRGRR